MKYQAAKGVFDILPSLYLSPEELWKSSEFWAKLEAFIRNHVHLYGFKEIRTPIFEDTDLFLRSIGDETDIVSKEMYTLCDKAGRSLTLRPEGTAAVVRSFIENKSSPNRTFHKFFYIGPMFRYERPQKGRYRQHHQLGVEILGETGPFQDAEIIEMLVSLYKKSGLQDLRLLINSVGDQESRKKYKEALQSYLAPYLSSLSSESQQRFSKNLLRILDSKDPQDREILKNSPLLQDFLTPSAKEHFRLVQEMLKELEVPFVVDPFLVRGLDYYNHTVFEVQTTHLGAQNSIGGGGRYDGLVEQLGGASIGSCGFGTGLERWIQALLSHNPAFFSTTPNFLVLIPLGQREASYCYKWACQMRSLSIPVEVESFHKKLKNSLQKASQEGVEWALIVGEEELSKGIFNLKNMRTHASYSLAPAEILCKLQGNNG